MTEVTELGHLAVALGLQGTGAQYLQGVGLVAVRHVRS